MYSLHSGWAIIYNSQFSNKMSSTLVFSVLVAYFGILVLISYYTSRNASTASFFNGNRQSPWFLVAFGMIGASLSGVTFISVPGNVAKTQFSYFQLVMGYMVGYFVIATILMPLYYRLNLISIYTYLKERFGFWTYKTGAGFFLLSRTIGTAFRLFLAVIALQIGLFDAWGFPFWLTTATSIALIWVYTFRGGIKTIVWTDTFQTTFLLLALLSSIYLIKTELNLGFLEISSTISNSKFGQVFFWDDWRGVDFFPKQFLSGMFIAIAMTGLDQDMMQKNLTCKSLPEAQKNMFWFSFTLFVVNWIFLSLGALLYIYAEQKGIILPKASDNVYPQLAFNNFGIVAGVAFLLGITAATYASSDSALTSLTTSFSIDFLNVSDKNEEDSKKIIRFVHLGFSILLLIIIVVFKAVKDAYPDANVITLLFKVTGYTYGPLLGLYGFGLATKRRVNDKLVPFLCLFCLFLSWAIDFYSAQVVKDFKFGSTILLVNGLLNFGGLFLISENPVLKEE